MMEEPFLQLLRDRFDSIESKLDSLNQDMRDHIEKDERYWARIDSQSGQISLLKWIFGGTGFLAILDWLLRKFGGH